MRIRSILGVLALMLSLGAIGFVAGCGDDDEESDSAATTTEETTAGGGGKSTSIEMTEYEFDPSDVSVSAGATLELENVGEIPHNYTIVEGDDPLGGGAELAASDDFAGGEGGEFTVDIEPGDYSVLCTIPGHAEDGMVGSIAVE